MFPNTPLKPTIFFQDFTLRQRCLIPTRMTQLDILYTPSDYDVKLIYQTWMHLLRTDFRQILETCADPPPLSINPLTLATLLDLNDRPALSTRYYDNCHIEAKFYIVSKNIPQDSLFDRLLILSISLSTVEQPDIHPDQIIEEKWPPTYFYDINTVDGTVNRLRGSIWATHTLKGDYVKICTVVPRKPNVFKIHCNIHIGFF